MSFAGYIWYFLNNINRSLTTGLRAFVQEFEEGKETLSKQAFSQGRKKIKPEAFRRLMEAMRDTLYSEADYQVWKGMRVTAIDGTRLNLPTSNELKEYYGIQESSGNQIQALSSSLYDVLNGITITGEIAPHDANERELAEKHLAELKAHPAPRGEQELVLFDRGYPSAELIGQLEKKGFKYLMRTTTTFISGMHIKEKDSTIMHQFHNMREKIKLRILKIKLDNGQEEILATNLFDESIQLEDFCALYRLRWKIETHYDDVKNKLWLEDFASKTVEGIQQEYFATLTVANLIALHIFDCQDEVEAQHSKEDNIYCYKSNMNVTIGMLKDELMNLVTLNHKKSDQRKLYLNLIHDVSRFVTPVRSGQSKPRKKAHPGAKFSMNNRLP